MPENEPTRRPPTIDAVAAARWARTPPAGPSPWLHEEVGRRMEDRLQWIKAQPHTWADWAPLRGGLEAHGLLARRYREAASFVVEPEPPLQQATAQALAQPWWSARRWNAARTRFGAESVPEEGVDLLWANMSLHSAADPQGLIGQWHRLVAPDTLAELRALYAAAGWTPAGHDFTDMHDWGDMLVGAGFAEPVMDMEHIQLTWSSPEALLAELRTLGRNFHPQRFAGLRGRGWRAQLHELLAGKMNTEGRISMTFEIIYGHAFKPKPKVTVSPESAVSLRDMRQMLQAGRGKPG